MDTRDDLDIRSTVQFDDPVKISCPCDRFHIYTRFQKLKKTRLLKVNCDLEAKKEIVHPVCRLLMSGGMRSGI